MYVKTYIGCTCCVWFKQKRKSNKKRKSRLQKTACLKDLTPITLRWSLYNTHLCVRLCVSVYERCSTDRTPPLCEFDSSARLNRKPPPFSTCAGQLLHAQWIHLWSAKQHRTTSELKKGEKDNRSKQITSGWMVSPRVAFICSFDWTTNVKMWCKWKSWEYYLDFKMNTNVPASNPHFEKQEWNSYSFSILCK